MGNCIETCKIIPQRDVNNQSTNQEEEVKASEFEKLEEKSMRIKIVLTKEELGWLMFELENTQGKRLEDILGQIQRSREKSSVSNWKPSLDSIVESPEVPDGMDR